jgi:hypothetical protein
MEMKHLFSLASVARTRGEVTVVIITVFKASDVGCGDVRHQCRIWCLALGDVC